MNISCISKRSYSAIALSTDVVEHLLLVSNTAHSNRPDIYYVHINNLYKF